MKTKITLGFDGELDGYDPKQVIALTFAEAKWNDIQARGGTLSNRFGINKTANNKRVLGLLDDIQNQDGKPYELHNCKIEVDGQPVFYGVAMIEESSDKYYLRVFGNTAQFFVNVGEKLLNEIDFTDLNHEWTAANVNANRQNTSGMVYPNVNYGRWTGKTLAARPHQDFLPATFMQEILERAAALEGYNLLNYSSQSILLYSKESLEMLLTAPAKIASSADDNVVSNALNVIPMEFWDDIISDPNLHTNQSTLLPDYYYYKTRFDGTYDFNLYLDWTTPDMPFVGGDVTFYIYASNSTAAPAAADPILGTFTVDGTTTGSHTLEVRGYKHDGANQNIFVASRGGGNASVKILEGSFFECIQGSERMVDGDLISIGDAVPEMTIQELFLFEATRRNALIDVNSTNKTIEFVKMNDIASRWITATDWSDKVNLLKDPKNLFRIPDYAQNNLFKWSDGVDEDPAYIANPFLGNAYFVVSDAGLKVNNDFYEAPFAASSRQTAFTDEVQLILSLMYSDPNLTASEGDVDPKFRVVENVIDDYFIVDITGEASLPTQSNPYFRTWQDEIDENYTALSSIFNKMKRVEVPVRLSSTDIQELDFTKPVFLMGEYWYIQEVKQWKANREGATLVKLLRL